MSINGAPVIAATVVAVDVGKNRAALLATDADRRRLLGPVEFAMTAPGLAAPVRIWDASGSGNPVGDPLTGHFHGVWAVAVGRLGERDVIVGGSSDDTVRIWDTGGNPLGNRLIGHTSRVNTVAVGRLGERDVIVSGGNDDTVRIWDSTWNPLGDPLIGHISSVSAVAVGRLGDRDVIVSGSQDNRFGSGTPSGTRSGHR